MFRSGQERDSMKAPGARDGGAGDPALSFCARDFVSGVRVDSASQAFAAGSPRNTWEIGAPLSHDETLFSPGSVFQSQIDRFHLQSVARVIMPETSLSSCLRSRRAGCGFVEVRKGQDRAYYGGLQTCGSVWACPVCSAKISERRRVELDLATSVYQERGGVVLLLSETVRHHAGQGLVEVLAGALNSRKLMMHRKPYKRLARWMHLEGSIRGLEVTWGANGWHVHFHELLFLRPGEGASVNAEVLSRLCLSLEMHLLPEWRKACVDVGLPEPDHHGVRVTGGHDVSRYVSKWGLSQEMTKGHIKKGRGANLTPWDFLRKFDLDQGDKWASLFREYSAGFKGKRQLVWSEGLKSLLGVLEISDVAAAAYVNPLDDVLALLDRSDWALVLRDHKRGELLRVAFQDGPEGVKAFLRILRRGGSKNGL